MLAIYLVGLVFTFILVGVYTTIYFSINYVTSVEKEPFFIMNLVAPLFWPVCLLIALFYVPIKNISNWAKNHEELIREKDKYGLFK